MKENELFCETENRMDVGEIIIFLLLRLWTGSKDLKTMGKTNENIFPMENNMKYKWRSGKSVNVSDNDEKGKQIHTHTKQICWRKWEWTCLLCTNSIWNSLHSTEKAQVAETETMKQTYASRWKLCFGKYYYYVSEKVRPNAQDGR